MDGSSSLKRPLDADMRSGSIEKRRRLSTPSYDEPSDSALLYYNARAAHIASTTLLQQAFLPQSVRIIDTPDVQPITAYPTSNAFKHDPNAATKVLALQIYALDSLKIGLKSGMLSIGEKAAFTVEFATIGIKVLESKAGNKLEGRDRIQRDIVAAVTELTNVELNPQMAEWKRHLEWLNVKLAFMTGRHNAAKRHVKQYSRSPRSYYALSFLQLQYSSPMDNLALLDEMMLRARQDDDRRMVQLLSLIHTRSLFTLRKWDLVPDALQQLGTSLGWDETSYTANGPSSGDALARHTYFVLHYMLLRCLWEGRIGHDAGVKALLKRLYLIVDEVGDADRFGTIRTRGGVIDIGSHDLRVQTTHANILFLMTFLVSVTSRRDYIGKDASCKSLLYAQALTEFAQVAKTDDIWDTGFNPLHGLHDVENLQAEVYSAQAEALLEEATTSMFRSNFELADEAIWKATRLMQQHQMQALLPHLCVAHGQLAQLLGVDKLATRYYEAALKLMVPGNELGMMVQASILGTRGAFERVQDDHQLVTHINTLGEKCKRSSSALLQVVGGVLLSITESNHHLAKRKISSTYDLCQTSNNNIIRGLIFAFTSTTHLTGSDDRIAKQLETGLEISSLLGGKDREDKVGQTVLGLWFALRLRSHHNRQRDMARLAVARSLAQRHQYRLNEIVEYVEKRYGAEQMGLLGELRGAARSEA